MICAKLLTMSSKHCMIKIAYGITMCIIVGTFYLRFEV